MGVRPLRPFWRIGWQYAPTMGIGGLKQRLAGTTSRRSRERKLEWLRARIEPGTSVLLVGVSIQQYGDRLGTDNYVEQGLVKHADATALVYEPEGDPALGCPFVRGSALELPFADGKFDYVVSNAVIEHVGGPAAAALMVTESRRVARRAAFHTTPYRWFPVETHTQVPLLHWLPRGWQHTVFGWIGRPWFNGQDYWLFGARGLRQLAPDTIVPRPRPGYNMALIVCPIT